MGISEDTSCLCYQSLFSRVSNKSAEGLGGLLLAHGLGLLTESVAKLPADEVEMPHPAGAGGLPPLGLHRPVVLPDASSRVATGSANLLLDVERNLPTAAAQRVRLVAPLSKGEPSLPTSFSEKFSSTDTSLILPSSLS